jgi:hypothetical protein
MEYTTAGQDLQQAFRTALPDEIWRGKTPDGRRIILE